MATLQINNLHAKVAEEGGETILRGVDLTVDSGEIHALMGPNGSGKSTTAKIIAGHPAYEVTDGQITLALDDEDVADVDEDVPAAKREWDLLDLEPNERAALGIFLGFQYPAEIEGVTMTNFLRQALNCSRTKTKTRPTPTRRSPATIPPRWRAKPTTARSASPNSSSS